MNVEIGAEAAQFPEKEYINGIALQCMRKWKTLKEKKFKETVSRDCRILSLTSTLTGLSRLLIFKRVLVFSNKASVQRILSL
jgi:hypothetical protein